MGVNVFTVINMNDNENDILPSADDLTAHPECNVTRRINNNPPTPPYINTNVLKRFINESKFIDQINDYIKACTSNGTINIDKNRTIQNACNELIVRYTEKTKTANKCFYGSYTVIFIF